MRSTPIARHACRWHWLTLCALPGCATAARQAADVIILFVALSLSTLLSSIVSATGFFRRRFSSSKERRRLTSDTSRSPRVFTASNVCCRESNVHPLAIPILGSGLGLAGRRNIAPVQRRDLMYRLPSETILKLSARERRTMD